MDREPIREPITVKEFLFFLRHLRLDLISESNLDLLSEPGAVQILDGSFLNWHLKHFFENRDDEISFTAKMIYLEYNEIYKNFPNFYRDAEVYDGLMVISQIRILLVLIKYSCTIIDESKEKTSAFLNNSVIDLMKTDSSLDPTNWEFLNLEQFNTKTLLSMGKDNVLEHICPVTNFPAGIYEIITKKFLLILRDEKYESFMRRMIEKYITKSSVEARTFMLKANAECFYSGRSFSELKAPYTDNFKELYEAVSKINKCYENKDIEVAFIVETVPAKAYGEIINIKFYVFRKEKDIGYVLHCKILCQITDKLIPVIFISKMIPVSFVLELLDIFTDFARSKMGDKPDKGPESKIFMAMKYLRERLEIKNYTCDIPKFIVYP